MKKTWFIFYILLTVSSYGQIKLEGVVTDSLKNPLESASLVAINEKTSNMESYVVTDQSGKYKLPLKTNTSYKIQVSYFGLRTIDEVIKTKETIFLRTM